MNIKVKKILAKAGLVLLGLIVVGFVVRGILDIAAGKRLESAIKTMKAEGQRLSVQDFEPKCRDMDNAALIWQGIEAMYTKDFNNPEVVEAPLENLREGKSLNPLTRVRIEATAQKYATLFVLMREAAAKPCFKYARRWRNVAFDLKYANLQRLSPFFNLFMLQAYLQADRGDQSRAVRDCLVALRLLSLFAGEPHPFNRFYGIWLMTESLEVLRSVLKKGKMDEKANQSVLEELDKQQPQQTLRLSLQLEQAMILEEYMHYFRGEVRENFADGFRTWLFKPRLKSEALFALNLGHDLNQAVNEPYYGPKKMLGQYMAKVKKIPGAYQLARVFHSSMGAWLWGKYVRLETILDVTRTALACRIYSLRHGHFPETLSQLANENLMKIPADPFTGRPLAYRRTPAGFVLYSLGPNQKDDGGRGQWGWVVKVGDDIAWEE